MGVREYFNSNSYSGAEGEQSHMSRIYGNSQNPNIKIHDVNRPAGCLWLKGSKGYVYFNHIIDPTLTNPKNFIDRGGVCKAPGNEPSVMSNIGYYFNKFNEYVAYIYLLYLSFIHIFDDIT